MLIHIYVYIVYKPDESYHLKPTGRKKQNVNIRSKYKETVRPRPREQYKTTYTFCTSDKRDENTRLVTRYNRRT